MTDRRALVLALLMTAAQTATADTADRPLTVSPGHASRLVRVGDRCPTFSWAQLQGTQAYELVVYRVGRDDAESPAVLRATIDGRAGSWTPTLGRCLERGGRYAWSIRARRGRSITGWSAPAMFEVAPFNAAEGSSVAELEEVLALLRQRAADGDVPATRPGAANSADTGTLPTDTSDSPTAGTAPSDEVATGDGATTALSVDGRIEAGSFSGDGSALANVEAAELSCVGCVAGGELADGAVTTAKIGAGCAAGQILMRGVAGWECATLTAPSCTLGDQIGCYTGPGGTLGVGECVSGTRLCAADASWGACSGEVIPAAVELCDGLDNTCDGPIDEGDPTTLCPVTANVAATLCDAAACAITDCAESWVDADGDYANGCEAPAPGNCLEAGSPRPIVAPAEGELVIQEILADPASPLADADAEWFEVVVKANVDLNGLGIGTTFGTVIDQIDVGDCLPVQNGDLLLFARSADPAVNGGLGADRVFNFSLVNGGGDLHLEQGGNLVDAVSWGAGDVAAGRARNLPPGFQDAASNDDPANWCMVAADSGLLYADGNYGTPGLGNVVCP